MAWLHARLSARDADSENAIRWLEIVLSLDAGHAEALGALEKLRPTRKGWFSWRR
jgi:hypothetical protein